MRRLALMPVVAGLITLVLGAGPGMAATHHDRNDAEGPLDLKGVRIDQSGKKLSLRLQARGHFPLRALSTAPDTGPADQHAYACFELRQDGRLQRDCFGVSPQGRPMLSSLHISPHGGILSRRHVQAEVKRPNRGSARAVASLHALKLAPGRFGWRVISDWDGHSCTAIPDPCEDSHPTSGLTRDHLVKPHIVGCRSSGPVVRTNGNRSRKRVALTFDDGPSAYTSHVLDILGHNHVNATFFLIGQEIPGRERLVRREVKEGNAVGDHSLHHESLPGSESIRITRDRIRAAAGYRPCLFRPPGGGLKRTTRVDAAAGLAKTSAVAAAARRLGMTTVLWDVDPQDWGTPGTGAIYSRVVNATSPGSIILLHDGGGDRSQTVAAVPQIIHTLRSRGYHFVTVPQLLHQQPIWAPR